MLGQPVGPVFLFRLSSFFPIVLFIPRLGSNSKKTGVFRGKKKKKRFRKKGIRPKGRVRGAGLLGICSFVLKGGRAGENRPKAPKGALRAGFFL